MTSTAHDRQSLVQELIGVIVQSVNLHHVDRSTLSENTSLRDGGLELDSIDILETIVAVENRYGIKIKDAEMGRASFRTIGTIADLVLTQAKPSA